MCDDDEERRRKRERREVERKMKSFRREKRRREGEMRKQLRELQAVEFLRPPEASPQQPLPPSVGREISAEEKGKVGALVAMRHDAIEVEMRNKQGVVLTYSPKALAAPDYNYRSAFDHSHLSALVMVAE